MVGPGPYKGANNGFREKEPAVIRTRFDRGDLDVWSYSNNPLAVGSRGDRSRSVRPMPISILRSKPRHRRTRQAISAVGNIDVLAQVRMIEVNARIDVADQHGRAAARYRVRLRRVNLAHVPLKTREAVRVGRRSVRQVTRLRAGSIVSLRELVFDLCGEGRSRRGAFDPVVFDDVRSEADAIGLRDGDANLRVAVDE